MKKECVLVTGGAGFVGGHFLRYLRNLGVSSIAVDDLSTGRLENLPSAAEGCDFVKADVTDSASLDPMVRHSSLVVHMAAVVGMQNVIDNPLKTIRTNVQAVAVLADLCCRYDVPLVNISSSAVYGLGSFRAGAQFDETEMVHSSGLHPASTYAESKSIGELICNSFYRSRGLKCLIVRPFNLIGPRQSSSYGMVVPRFVRCVLANSSMPIHGDGTQTRTFSDVRQAVGLLWNAIRETSWKCEIVNLATNESAISILELATKVSGLLGQACDYHFVEYGSAFGQGFIDVHARRPNLRALRRLVGFWNPISLEETIQTIVDYELAAFGRELTVASKE